jgi:hypothetical protein
MAREAGIDDPESDWMFWNAMERFAALVRADAIAGERNSWPAEMEAMERQVNILTDALAQAKADEREKCETVSHCLKNGCVPKQPSKDEALKLALEALETLVNGSGFAPAENINKAQAAITAIKQALAAPVQEPVAWRFTGIAGFKRFVTDSQYKAFNPEVRAWYEPFKCTSCVTPPAKPAPVQEPVAWKNAALELGIELSSVGPNGYYDMPPERWLDWAMAQQPRGKNSLPAAKRQWVSLTDEDIEQEFGFIDELLRDCVHRTEAKLKEKNT